MPRQFVCHCGNGLAPSWVRAHGGDLQRRCLQAGRDVWQHQKGRCNGSSIRARLSRGINRDKLNGDKRSRTRSFSQIFTDFRVPGNCSISEARRSSQKTAGNRRLCRDPFVPFIRRAQEGCGGLRGENPAAFPQVRPVFQQLFSLPESAQTLAGIASRAAVKSGNHFPAASKFAGKPFLHEISHSHSLLEFSEFSLSLLIPP